tara:strand:- start:368 stop:1456 length:1089 start_codon:yes stop_codon:yes gene_type:complete
MILRAENIKKKYGKREVVKGVSIEVKQGEIVGLLGPNGAGKTTSFYMIVGLIKPNGGRVFLDEKEITQAPMYKRAQMGIGYLPQEVSVFRKLSVEDNISAILEMMPLSKEEQKNRLEELIEEFSLGHVRKNLGHNLSGGEKRRTEIARALASNPSFILLDEPFAGVDPIAVEDIQTIVAKLKDKNIGILITDHNVQETLSITDRAYLLFEGAILKAGTAEELANDEQVRRVYLGKHFELKRKDFKEDNSILKTLENYNDWELAFMKRYNFNSYSNESKNIIEKYLKETNITEPKIDLLIKNHQKINDDKDRCPRCSSDKLITIKVERESASHSQALDSMVGKVNFIDKIDCQVCGLNIIDPN